MYVKICGLRTADTLDAAVAAGADAVGFVFAPGSPRLIGAEAARELARRVPAAVETVGVFRRQPIEEVLATASAARLTTVQLHGDEEDAAFERLRAEGFRTIRALAWDGYLARPEMDPADRLLLDAPVPGSGARFDTDLLAERPPQGFWLLAGGLDPDNVGAAVRSAAPGGVDVSSGVESEKGVKSADLIRRFVAAARNG
ncbi:MULTISPECIES: phosphoribosylanthranilate isomerase [unclassified Streptomyces]|uniref:phosphoribosylanthranilate isomerase n=1 Tax=unclassified Streptomyces TaxID=2593676 RepID=UPI002DD87E4B|nr:phosphoribosylanthranilate isomerase [Streptomyces sp. NBC_01445]WSE02516.1 phosphoribosylanthranilate isomerase [Streptomyces sp. NBC_01445]